LLRASSALFVSHPAVDLAGNASVAQCFKDLGPQCPVGTALLVGDVEQFGVTANSYCQGTYQGGMAPERPYGFSRNGILLKKAEETGFEVLVTTDSSMTFQQNLAGHALKIYRIAGTQQ
jgi:hypothetical protein